MSNKRIESLTTNWYVDATSMTIRCELIEEDLKILDLNANVKEYFISQSPEDRFYGVRVIFKDKMDLNFYKLFSNYADEYWIRLAVKENG